MLALGLHLRLAAEQLLDPGLGAPLQRRGHAGRRRHVGADDLEHLADEPLGGPVGQADAAAGAHHAEQLGRRPLGVRREHHADGRQHDVEAGVLERQVLGVGHLGGEREPVGVRPSTGPLEQGLDVVGGGDVAAPASGGERRVAVAGGDVEHGLPGRHVDGLAEPLADDLQRRADDGVVARGPGGLLLLLDRREGVEGQGGGHCSLLLAPVAGAVSDPGRVRSAARVGGEAFDG